MFISASESASCIASYAISKVDLFSKVNEVIPTPCTYRLGNFSILFPGEFLSESLPVDDIKCKCCFCHDPISNRCDGLEDSPIFIHPLEPDLKSKLIPGQGRIHEFSFFELISKDFLFLMVGNIVPDQ